MKYFIDENTQETFAYESDGSQDSFIRSDLLPISDEEFLAIKKAQDALVLPDKDQLKHEVSLKRDELLTYAGLRIAPLQDAIDLGKGTAHSKVALSLWKQYRIDVDLAATNSESLNEVTWPKAPA